MLLPTVYSRCLKIPFSLTAKETIKNHPGFSQRRAPLELLAQYSMGRPGCACFWQNNKNAVSQFKSQALAVLKFLQAGFPENLSRLPKADEKAEQEMFNLLELFQIICRDALLYACGVGQPAILLSRDPKIKDIGRMRQALRQSLRLAGILEKAVSPLALTRCFEYLAVKT